MNTLKRLESHAALMFSYLKKRKWISGCLLLQKLLQQAQSECVFATELLNSFENGDTVKLRELCQEHGNYWKDLAFFNTVNSIDTSAFVCADNKCLKE